MLTFGEKQLSWKVLLPQLLILALSLIIGVRDHRLMLIAFAFSLVNMVMGRNLYVICQLFFLLPFTVIYKSGPTTSSYFAYTIILFSAFLVFQSKVNVGKIALIAIYLLVGLTNKFDIWLKMISGMIILLYFVKNVSRDSFKYIAISFAVGVIISSIIGLDKMSSPLLSEYYKSFNNEYIAGDVVYRFSGLYYDPNYYSITVACSIFFITSLIVVKDIKAIVGIPLVIALTYFGTISYSRLFLVAIILIYASQTWDLIWYSRYRLLVFLFVLVLLIVGIPLLRNTMYYGYYNERLNTEDISGGRLSIWKMYMEQIFSSASLFLFGVGVGGKLLNHVGAHNTFIEALYDLGLFGFILYVITFFKVLKSNSLLYRRSYKNYTFLFVFLIMITTLGVLTMNDMMFYLMVIWCSFNIEYPKVRLSKSIV